MNIIIHRGTDQIGGCVTEYEHEGWKLFVDFGEQLPGATPSVNFEVEGLTKGDLSKSALLITHYHGDHIGKIAEVAESVPVYMGHIAREIYQKLQRRLTHINGEAGKIAQNAYDRSCKINTFRDEEIFHFGPFEIKPVKMDHSAYDSYGFVISIIGDENDRVFHTGDFRVHGLYGQKSYDRITRLPSVKAIICEATNIERCEKDAESEQEIQERFEELFRQHKYNSVFVSSTNIDRLFGIYRAATAAGKIVLVDEYQNDILQYVVAENDSCDKFDKDILFTLKLDYTKRNSPEFSIPSKLQKLINWKGCVLIARSTPQFVSLINNFPKDKSCNYLSMWEGYVNSESPAYKESVAYALGDDYIPVHTSGHADLHTLETLFSNVRHNTIIPIHTNNPEKFREYFEAKNWNITLLKDGETFDTNIQ